jgi:hypothetical protein
MLVIEKYDQKEILQPYFIENDWMFKVALYGNALDYLFLKRINDFKSFQWMNQSIKGKDGFKRDRLKKFNVDNVDKLITEKENIKVYYTPSVLIDIEENISQNFGKERIILKGQTLLESDLVVSYSQGKAIFRNDTFLLTTNQQCKLELVLSEMIAKLYPYFIFLTSSTWGVSTRPAIRLKEYLSFPFIQPNSEKIHLLVNLINGFLQPFKAHYQQELPMGELPIDYKILDEINEIINQVYEISPLEKDLIDYVLDVSRYQFQASKIQKIIKPVSADIDYLTQYATIFIDEFSKIYYDQYLQVEVYSLDYFIAMNFVFHKEKPDNYEQIIFSNNKNISSVLIRLANNLSISQITNAEDSQNNLFLQKDIKGFEKESFFIIKPNEFKCWHRAMAWYDVAEFKDEIQKAELKRLNAN